MMETNKPRILLIEDNIDLRASLADGLEADGYNVIQSAHFQDIIRDLPSLRVTVAIIDLVLEGASGATLVHYIRSHARLKNIKVILMSGMDHGAKTAEMWGADLYLQKPLTAQSLDSAIRQLIAAPNTSC
jgi:DNA-binding response OmpR family regulator